MSSTAAVASSVSYHLNQENLENVSNYSHAILHENSTKSSKYNSVPSGHHNEVGKFDVSANNLVSNNLDAALLDTFRGSLHPVMNHNAQLSNDINRSLRFQESTAPSLDVIIRQRIQSLPKHLILTDKDKTTHLNPNALSSLCSTQELNELCNSGPLSIPRKSLGLGNAGNTCYMNSVLQCLLATGPLLSYINQEHSKPNQCPVISEQNKSRFCGLCGLSRLLKEHSGQLSGNNSSGYTVPSYFVCNVRAICPNLRPYQQEDAHEFLLGLLSRMEDSVLAGLGKVPRKLSETNVIRRIFGSIIRSEVTCHVCKKVSARDESCFNISVDVTCGRSLQQCLFNYIRREELCDQNAYKCENCRQLRPAVRRSTLFEIAPILIIQLNRFSRSQKLDARVEFPLSFNLRPFMTESKGSPVLYRLYATVNHEGHSCRSGHYVAFSRRHGSWFSHNDSFVNAVNPDTVLRQSPYLLFYEASEPVANTAPSPRLSPLSSKPGVTSFPTDDDDTSALSDPTAIPVSQIPLPPSNPTPKPHCSVANKASVTTVCSKPNTTSAPRIIFNQAVINKLPQAKSCLPTKLSLPVLNAGSKITPPTNGPSSVNGSVRKLLQHEHSVVELWSERPTPTLNHSPLEESATTSTLNVLRDTRLTVSPHGKRSHASNHVDEPATKKISPNDPSTQNPSDSLSTPVSRIVTGKLFSGNRSYRSSSSHYSPLSSPNHSHPSSKHKNIRFSNQRFTSPNSWNHREKFPKSSSFRDRRDERTRRRHRKYFDAGDYRKQHRHDRHHRRAHKFHH